MEMEWWRLETGTEQQELGCIGGDGGGWREWLCGQKRSIKLHETKKQCEYIRYDFYVIEWCARQQKKHSECGRVGWSSSNMDGKKIYLGGIVSIILMMNGVFLWYIHGFLCSFLSGSVKMKILCQISFYLIEMRFICFLFCFVQYFSFFFLICCCCSSNFVPYKNWFSNFTFFSSDIFSFAPSLPHTLAHTLSAYFTFGYPIWKSNYCWLSD